MLSEGSAGAGRAAMKLMLTAGVPATCRRLEFEARQVASMACGCVTRKQFATGQALMDALQLASPGYETRIRRAAAAWADALAKHGRDISLTELDKSLRRDPDIDAHSSAQIEAALAAVLRLPGAP